MPRAYEDLGLLFLPICDVSFPVFSLGYMTYACIGVLFGMVFLCTIFLLVSLVSTGRTSKQLFDSMKKNYCARAINVVVSTYICTQIYSNKHTFVSTGTSP